MMFQNMGWDGTRFTYEGKCQRCFDQLLEAYSSVLDLNDRLKQVEAETPVIRFELEEYPFKGQLAEQYSTCPRCGTQIALSTAPFLPKSDLPPSLLQEMRVEWAQSHPCSECGGDMTAEPIEKGTLTGWVCQKCGHSVPQCPSCGRYTFGSDEEGWACSCGWFVIP